MYKEPASIFGTNKKPSIFQYISDDIGNVNHDIFACAEAYKAEQNENKLFTGW